MRQYHVFIDGKDWYFSNKKDAYKKYRELCKGYESVRIYFEPNEDEEEFLDGKGGLPW
jgi:hypothetical protein